MIADIQRRIEIFNEVRNLEYRFDLLDVDKDQSCRGKVRKLLKGFKSIDLIAQPICCRVLWRNGNLPQDLLARTFATETQHWFARVTIPETGKDVDVDPTWDPALKGSGFPVAEWDGLNSTVLAVQPFSIFSPSMSAHIWDSHESSPLNDEESKEFIQTYGDFYRNMNKWIHSQRRQLGSPHA